VKVRADIVDLMIEADRTDYVMQVENQPFHPQNETAETAFGAAWEQVKEDLSARMKWDQVISYKEAIQEAKDLIRDTCDPNEFDLPQLDPNLFGTNMIESLHPKILKFVGDLGHRGDVIQGKEVTTLDRWTTGWSKQCYISPYAEYKIDAKFQPLYKKYKVSETSTNYTLFRQVDRIRLVSSIIGRNLNLESMVTRKVIKFSLWLHDPFTYRDLRANWALKFLPLNITRGQPISLIRDYYGEKTALYFAWLQYYTRFLIPIGVLGIIVLILTERGSENIQGGTLVIYGGLVSIWATLFLEVWKRRNAELNLMWGTANAKLEERERPEFVGVTRRNPVTDELEVYHERLWWYQQRLITSTCVLAVFIIAVIGAVVGIFIWKAAVEDDIDGSVEFWQLVYIGIVNAAQIGFFNSVYRMVAQVLNDWENHRTPTEYENNLTIKVFVFQFVNSFSTFFTIAFVKNFVGNGCVPAPNCDLDTQDGNTDSNGNTLRIIDANGNTDVSASEMNGFDFDACDSCLYELQTQLLSIFLTRLVVSNMLEVGIPYMKYRLALYLELRNASKASSQATNAITGGIGEGVDAVTNIAMRFEYEQAEKETKFNKYEELEAFDDYNEIVLQFGFVSLFVVGFPLIPFLALINNIAEMHIDGFKLTSNMRRPFPVRSANIGSWYFFLDLMSLISVMTNIGIIIFTSPLFEERGWSVTERFLLFIFAEHALLLLKFVISNAVPDEHGTISTLRARHENIVQRVFLGLEEDDNSKFEEAAEKVNLVVHEKTAKKVNIITEAIDQTGQALRDAGQTVANVGSGV